MKLIRDALGSPVPQTINESGNITVDTSGGNSPVVTADTIINALGYTPADRQRLEQIDTQKAPKTDITRLENTKADLLYVETLVGNAVGGEPKETFLSVAALNTAYPTGANFPVFVYDSSLTDGAHVYSWNGTEWMDLGLYQGIDVRDKSITTAKLSKDTLNLLGKFITNELKNSNFSQGIENWSTQAGTISASGGILTNTVTSTSGSNVHQVSALHVKKGHKYYLRARIRVKNSLCQHVNVSIQNTSGVAASPYATVLSPIENEWYEPSFVASFTDGVSGNLRAIRISHHYVDSATALGKQLEVENAIMIDLTENFGFGNEPSKNEIDEIINLKFNGWFEGTQSYENIAEVISKLQHRLEEMEEHITPSENEELDLFIDNKTDDVRAVDVSAYEQILLVIDKLAEGIVKIQATNDNVTYFDLKAINLATNNELSHVTQQGRYAIDVRGYMSVRFTLKMSRKYAVPSATVRLHLLNNPIFLQPNPPKVSKTPNANVTMYDNGERVRCLTKDGIAYARRENLLRKSINKGQTWTTVPFSSTVTEFPTHANAVFVADNGRIVFCGGNGKVYTSNGNGQNFVETLDMSPAPVHPELFGGTQYGNMIALAGYNPNKALNVSHYVFLSQDGGATWTTMFDAIALGHPQAYHVHDVRYDPYEDLFWVAVGDGAQSMIYYTPNKGGTWYQAYDFGVDIQQITQICPLPNCVLFITDARLTGVKRYNRPNGGTPFGQTLPIETALLLYEDWGKELETEVPIASYAAMDYVHGRAYFGYGVLESAKAGGYALKNNPIWATEDGFNFFKIFSTAQDSSSEGVMGVFGVDEDGDMIASIKDRNLSRNNYLYQVVKMNVDWN